MMPPPQQNTVDMTDLRRLGNRAGSRPATGPQTFGPPSMFSTRGSNPKRSFGPPGSFLARGEDSGASSRTGTPPFAAARGADKKEKEDKQDTMHANAFR